MELTLDIYKDEVYTEVAQTSSYTGAKMDDDANAYERIFTTDEGKSQLERFWNESCVTFCEIMKRYLISESDLGNTTVTRMAKAQTQSREIQEQARGGIEEIPFKPWHPDSPGEENQTVIGHRFKMDFSKSFDPALIPSMRPELFSYFVMNITAKWYGFTNKQEAGEYAAVAAALLEGIHRKACYKRKPQRPTY